MESGNHKKCVLFDFDGVIVDTFNLCLEIERKLQDGSLSEEDYRARFEGNIYDYHKTLDDDTKENDNVFFKHYNPELMRLNPVKGITQVLEDLAKNYILVIVSSTINNPIEEYLEQHDSLRYFDKIFGSDVHKSKVEKIKMVFDKYNVQPDDCIFITDTLGDMREAARVGVRSIAVTWGYHGNDRLERGNPIAIVDTPDKISEQVNEYFRT